jgi:hypothetical protein
MPVTDAEIRQASRDAASLRQKQFMSLALAAWSCRTSCMLFAAIVAAWILVACALDQSFLAVQHSSVAVYPELVSSGASQPLMALCGAALLLCRFPMACLAVLLILTVQLGLDLRAVGTVKAGHGRGLAAGILVGTGAMLVPRRNATATIPTRSGERNATRDTL